MVFSLADLYAMLREATREEITAGPGARKEPGWSPRTRNTALGLISTMPLRW